MPRGVPQLSATGDGAVKDSQRSCGAPRVWDVWRIRGITKACRELLVNKEGSAGYRCEGRAAFLPCISTGGKSSSDLEKPHQLLLLGGTLRFRDTQEFCVS